MPITAPATMSTPYTASVTRMNEPLRFVSSECDPDSTRFSNIFSVLLRCQKGQAKSLSKSKPNNQNDCNFKYARSNPLDARKEKGKQRKWPDALKPSPP